MRQSLLSEDIFDMNSEFFLVNGENIAVEHLVKIGGIPVRSSCRKNHKAGC